MEDMCEVHVSENLMGLRWTNTIKALAYARAKHSGQSRKNGESYIIHPLTVASHALALGVRDDATIAACLLHDVMEDCGASPNDLPVDQQVKEIVVRLTYVPQMGQSKNVNLSHYYKNISENHTACQIKLLDRCNNVSTMAGVFSREKMMDYVKETKDYILPLLRETKENWPEDFALLYKLKYHIVSVVDAIEACMSGFDDDLRRSCSR